MNRHFKKTKLFNRSLFPILPHDKSIWDLSPLAVAQFGGELTRVMLEAAEQYIIEKSLLNQKKVFEDAAFHQKNLP